MSGRAVRWALVILISFLLSTVKALSVAEVISQSSDEAAIRQVIEEFFSAYAREDIDAIAALWKKNDFSTQKNKLERLFADFDRMEVSAVSLRSIRIDGDSAQLIVSVEINAVGSKTGKPASDFGKQNRSFHLVREAGAWRIDREESAEAELAAILVAAKTTEEQAAILDTHKELVTSKLCDSLISLGRSFTETNKYNDAQVAFQLARTLAEQLRDTPRLIMALSATGNLNQARGDLSTALDIHQQALRLGEAGSDESLLAGLENNVCSIHARLANYEQATQHCDRSLALAESSGNKTAKAAALNTLGIIARQRGNYERALESYGKALALEEELGNKRNVARLLNNLGVAYNAMGNTSAALQHYARSLPIAEEIGNKFGVASTLSNMSMIYRELGNYKLALEHSQRSFEISEAIGDKSTLSFALEELGKLHAQAGEYSQALECYRKSLELVEQTGEKVEIAIRLLSVGNGYRNLGNDSQAVEYYQRGLSLAESVGIPFTAVAIRFKLAQLYTQQGRTAEAFELAERSVTQARQIGAHKDFWQALLISGIALRALKRPEEARKRFEEAINVIEAARNQLVAGEREQASYFENRFDPYAQMVTLLAEQSQASEAFGYAERAKARVLLDVLQAGRVDINKAMSEREREQEFKLKTDLNSLSAQLRRASQTAGSEPARLEDLKSKLSKSRMAYETFQTQLYASHPELRIKRGQAQPVALEQAGELLTDERTALVEYVVAHDRILLFVLTPPPQKGPGKPVVRLYQLGISQKELVDRVERFNQQIAGNDIEYAELSGQLFNLLLTPAMNRLRGKNRIIIVPDDILWEVPFQALRSPEGRFLIQNAAISYAPSLTVLREITKSSRSKPASTLLAMGNPKITGQATSRSKNGLMSTSFEPLPDAERMVKGLAQLYGDKSSKVYVGADAREEVLKAEADKYRVLQLATHGVINNASPMYSHVVLAQGGESKEDGLLEAWEIMQMDLKADLAVLSACETARGRIGAGEGVIGLSWALFVAGCPTTVVSQWKVESSSTTELMLAFHHNLKLGLNKSEAMRQAAIKLMADKRYSHPFYWAGFIVVGDWR
jgi:CHAT domain-containing protein/ketosteroid isomerase-like protein